MDSTASAQPPVPLCIADDQTFWPWSTWTDFARRSEAASTTVVLPVTGMADWGLGLPLDAEEIVALSVLRAAAARPALPPGRLLVLPPQRFVLGPSPYCAFPTNASTTHAALAEWCESVAAAGFRRIVFYNSSPWNEELIDAAARDLRITRGWQTFCINLSALDLDFAPWRRPADSPLPRLWQELAGPGHAGPLLQEAASTLVELLREIAARPGLPSNGSLRRMTADSP